MSLNNKENMKTNQKQNHLLYNTNTTNYNQSYVLDNKTPIHNRTIYNYNNNNKYIKPKETGVR